jgi:hypothetical protein
MVLVVAARFAALKTLNIAQPICLSVQNHTSPRRRRASRGRGDFLIRSSSIMMTWSILGHGGFPSADLFAFSHL